MSKEKNNETYVYLIFILILWGTFLAAMLYIDYSEKQDNNEIEMRKLKLEIELLKLQQE